MDSRRYEKDVIEERRNQGVREFFMSLEQFVLHNITATIIDQDLNVLLPPEKFQMARKFLKQETLVFLRDEIARLK
jgi:DNA-binding response OmpR family regulator